ncbi:PREDICTED: sodium- and chloride-dependent glycine transporter 2-like [Acropora digitifera]|uniref:sodium- and chloride-dependent glycine transporter 2-like n=1 Tax=Acropora digitifera TaxID=70779 RepID=UPI00077AEF41|nr:PREDICTED: sodium- and chloride-dependent glycine transporter 2-like [Acropora digitifera]
MTEKESIVSASDEIAEKPQGSHAAFVEQMTVEEGDVVVIEEEREKWGKKIDFMLSCIGYAVGLGNVWRFPYLCYENGGATFLIPYFIMLAINGIPLFYMELAIGQYLSLGTVGAWTALCPIARGIGFGMIMVSFLVSIYYNLIIAWCLLYLFESFRKDVPWKNCGNNWNTPLCSETTERADFNCSAIGLAVGCKTTSPSEEFFNHYILKITDSISDMGSVSWQIVLCLILAWLIVYLCLIKGVASSGKVVYFTATFPYVVLFILMIRGATLEGSLDGVLFYLRPDVSKLKDPRVWVRAASQIFYSLGVGFGSLITFGSYNKFNNNCERDAIIVSCVNCGTSFFAGFVVFSVLGFMAQTLKVEVGDVVTSGPGLAFVGYPEAIAQMPVSTLWAILFFFMLLTLGLDSQFAMVECVVTGLSDEYPKYLRRYKPFFLIGVCVLMFLLAIPMCSQGGMYVFNLFDMQSGGISLLFIGFCEAAVIGWGVGTQTLGDMIEKMIGKRPNIFFLICWKYLSPLATLVIIIASLAQWGGISYDKKPYPGWAEFFGWLLALASMVMVPIFAIVQCYYCKGTTITEKLRSLLTPDDSAFVAVEEREGISRKKLIIK